MIRCGLIVVGLVLTGCAGESTVDPDSRVQFRDHAVDTGLVFEHSNGMSGEFYLAEVIGSGAALFDADTDGDLDAYLVQGALLGSGKTAGEAIIPWAGERAPRDRLFRNELQETGELAFSDVTEASGLSAEGYGMGVAAGDVDNDGDIDLYVTNLGDNQLFLNTGRGTFVDAPGAAGAQDGRFSTSAAFVDYDADGWLDLYVGNYVDFNLATHKECFSETSALEYCHPLSYQPTPDRLFRNRGDGSFVDVSAATRIALEYGGALGVLSGDFNADGRPDLYVANDAMPNQLWINQGDGRFANEALLAGCAFNANGAAEASMGVTAGDFDADGDEDLFMTHLRGETNTLYLNDGRGSFLDRTVPAGLAGTSRAFTGFGAGWIDYDNDGWLDLVSVNGAVNALPEFAGTDHPFPLGQADQLFRNLGDVRFEDVSSQAGSAFSRAEVSRGAALGDVDNDGDMDVLVVNNSGLVRLHLNSVGSRSRWLGLRLTSRRQGQGERDQYGALVEVHRDDGRVLSRRVRADGSYCSSNDPRLLFGLGEAGRVESVRVQWPDGRRESWDWSGRAHGAYTTLQAGTGQALD
jgi:hypothetical protein